MSPVCNYLILFVLVASFTVKVWVTSFCINDSQGRCSVLCSDRIRRQQSTATGRMSCGGTDYSRKVRKDCAGLALFMSISEQQREKNLRQEISERQSQIEDEARYAVPDGAYLDKLDEMLATSASSTENDGQQPFMGGETSTETAQSIVTNSRDTTYDKDLLAQMKQITRPRPYPLFLAEKFAEFVEVTANELSKTFSSEANPAMDKGTNGAGKIKEKIVVLGTGWGGVSFVKNIDAIDLYDVTIISPRNHFVFTPMLAGASVGTVEFRSICEPIREINGHASFLEATATDVDPKKRQITCESVVCDGNSCEIEQFTVDYDKLIVSVGAQTNTFGIKGVKENCNFLRQVEDARRIRNAIVNCFERANLPTCTDEEREHCLTFAVIGAGPTGIEFAAELRDFIEQDGPKYYPKLLKFVRIKIIEASGTVLAPFDKSLQQEAIDQMNRQVKIRDTAVRDLLPERFQLVELLLETSVQEVGEKLIYLKDGTSLPYGLAVWAAGNGPIQLTLRLIDSLGEEQRKEQAVARGRLAIDPWMRVIGSEGTILSFGDCSCITSSQLPATAQVASQQGEYLAALLNKKFDFSPSRTYTGEDGIVVFPPPKRDPARTETTVSDAIASFAVNNNEFAKPFQFLNLGILAYTGDGSALAQVTPAPDAPPVKGSGKIGNAVWRSVYLTKQISMRNRLLVLNDWTKRLLFGRDITRL